MRYALIATAALAFASPAFAGDKMKNATNSAPTATQCQEGWKADYSGKWTEAQFKSACDTIMKSGGKM